MTGTGQDVSKVEDLRAEALFETTAEVLGGLTIAYEHYECGRKRPGGIRYPWGR